EQIIINERWAQIIGYSLSELVPVNFKKWAELCHPDDLKKSNELLAKHFAGETDYYECEVRLRHKNDEWVWILDRGKVFEWDKDGKPIRMTGTHLDITERKRAEDALIDESVRRRLLFELAKDGIVILDRSRKVVEANKSFGNMLGYTAEEMCQLYAWDWEANYPTQEQFLEKWPELPTTSDTVETHHRRKDGTIYDVEVSWNPMTWRGQQLLYCVCRDITERKRADEALRESEELYRSTLKASPDSIAIYDLEGRIRIVSPSKLKLLGYTREEDIVGRSIQDFVHPKDHDRIRFDIGRVLQGISIGVNEYTAIHADGRAFTVESNAEVIRDTAGNPTGMVVITRDITERKRIENALRQSERNYRQIFNATNEAIFLHNGVTGNLLDVNDTMVRMYGYETKEEVLRRDRKDFIANEPPYTYEESLGRIRLAIEQGPQVFEWRAKKKNGNLFWVEVSLRSAEIGGERCVLAVVHNITERKRAEEALRESEERFRRIFYTSPDAIIISRVEDGLFVDINPSVTRLADYTREDMIGKTSYEVNIWADSEDRQELVRRLKDVGYCDNYESQFRRKDGSIGLGLVSACVMLLQGVPYIVSITRDITERKRAEEALKESEERFRRIFYTNPDAIIITRAEDGRFVDINPSVTRITGYTREDAIGKTSIEVNIWANLKDRQELISRLKETGYYENFELGVRRKDGSIGIGLMSACMMLLEGVPHIVSITRDISEYKRAEEEIRKLSEVVRQSPVSVVITGTDGAISYVNPKFSEVTGYTLEEVKGQNPRILKSGVTPPEEYKILWDTITGGKVWQGRFHNKKKDGGLFWEDATISPIFDKNRQITHFLAIKEDISHNIALEQQLRQAQKMEAIGHLAGGVAHDFNNLLLVIKGFSDLVLRKIAPENPNYEHIQQIQRAGDRAAELTRQLLAFSRKQILQPKILDLTALLKDMEKMLRRIIGEDIDLFTIYEDDLYQVKADPGQIEQVILNLAVNARDAMPSGGKLTIESHNACLDEAYVKANEGSAIGHYAMIAITDTGIGIDKQTQAHIFEPFFTTKDVGKGTGLGLSTVYGIIKQSGGNIWVYSETGIGTTFKIYLPSIDDAGEMPKQHTKSKNAIRGTETILIVEDEDVVCELLKTGLEDLGYKTFNAYSGPKALELIEKHSEEIHMLLTDVVMPEMSGRELADKVEVRYPNIKTLFMSGYTDSEIVHHSVLDEGVAFIQKPFTIPTVAKKIRAMLDEKQPD
ncbi:MAG: PAS domain S-box protein, partial [Chlorobiales bacterium]|nr:PAS domain S-box protein [Chlorobiales bacterium]